MLRESKITGRHRVLTVCSCPDMNSIFPLKVSFLALNTDTFANPVHSSPQKFHYFFPFPIQRLDILTEISRGLRKKLQTRPPSMLPLNQESTKSFKFNSTRVSLPWPGRRIWASFNLWFFSTIWLYIWKKYILIFFITNVLCMHSMKYDCFKMVFFIFKWIKLVIYKSLK